MTDELSLDLFGDSDAASDSDAPRGAEAEPTVAGATSPETVGTEERVWSVSQVNRAVKTLLEDAVDQLWVGGEIGQWTRSRPGHRYFSLKDDKAQLRCVMFSRDAQQLPVDPEEGMKVRVYGRLTLYEARGEYQLVASRIEAEGVEGLWRLAFEKLRAKLDAEGLLDPARKRPLPTYPAVVGVVTSPTGAALRDIVSVLRRRAPWVRVVLAGTRVQGEGASLEIAQAIDRLATLAQPDVIVVSRGGGSVEDLWAFNEEPVARAIAGCPIPVVSGVGHEVDVTIADLVADARAPTPSAAAEAVVPDAAVLREALGRVPERLARGLRGTVRRRRDGMVEYHGRLRRTVERRVEPLRQTADRQMYRLEQGVRALTRDRRQQLAAFGGKLDALSPLATLGRGYAVALGAEGEVLRSVEDFPSGRRFDLRVSDGVVAAEARESEESAENE